MDWQSQYKVVKSLQIGLQIQCNSYPKPKLCPQPFNPTLECSTNTKIYMKVIRDKNIEGTYEEETSGRSSLTRQMSRHKFIEIKKVYYWSKDLQKDKKTIKWSPGYVHKWTLPKQFSRERMVNRTVTIWYTSTTGKAQLDSYLHHIQ